MTGLATIILAGGKGTRMKSSLVKVLHPIMGKPMLSYPIEASFEGLDADKTVVVVGHQLESVQKTFSKDPLTFVSQQPQLGSGHAVLCTEKVFRGYEGTILILCGDVPLVRPETLTELVAFHRHEGATLTVVTTRLSDPRGYGRVVRGKSEQIEKIIEEKDASPREKELDEVNTGLYCAEASFLFPGLRKVETNNRQGEYYLTDLVEIGWEEKQRILAFEVPESDQFLGINTRVDLARAHDIVGNRHLQRWMLDGVTIIDPKTTYIETDVTLGKDTVIHPNCVIQGKTAIGRQCVVGPHCLITNSQIDDGVTLRAFSVIEESRIGRGAIVGPFSRIRPQSQIFENAQVGNFVEINKSSIGKGSKAKHLAYIGDATLGEKVNIGAGTIFCNYDGFEKHPTIVGDGVFVGSNAELIAPVKIGDDAIIAAGSTITRDVPAKSLAVSRINQKNVAQWRDRRLKKK